MGMRGACSGFGECGRQRKGEQVDLILSGHRDTGKTWIRRFQRRNSKSEGRISLIRFPSVLNNPAADGKETMRSTKGGIWREAAGSFFAHILPLYASLHQRNMGVFIAS